jgi:catechol 2,3-dioxygenase
MAAPAAIDPSLRIAGVRLAVADLARSVDFYERVLGLPLLSRDDSSALLGPDARRPALALSAIEQPTPLSPHAAGLFHVAWLHPSRGALADTVRRIARERWPIEGASDHGVSEALYLGDPDGLGIEIYADRPRELWPRPPEGHGVQMVTLALDLDDLLAQSALDEGPATGEHAGVSVAPGTTIGHVHLKVADVPRAAAFYRDVLGFEQQAELPSAAFLSAGGYHHHIGLNSWQSSGASAPPDSAPALREIDFELGGADALRALAERTTAGVGAGEPLAIADPDGVALVFSAAPPVIG